MKFINDVLLYHIRITGEKCGYWIKGSFLLVKRPWRLPLEQYLLSRRQQSGVDISHQMAGAMGVWLGLGDFRWHHHPDHADKK
jgi:hypothetical protein